MAWLFLSIFLFPTTALKGTDTLLVQQSQEQVRQYIDAVHNHKETAVNLWALAEVSRDHPNIQSYITIRTAEKGYTDAALRVFRDTTLSYPGQLSRLAFTAESPTLLAAYLLAEPNAAAGERTARRYRANIGYPSSGPVDYAAVVSSLLSYKPITPAMLPAGHFYPLHFFLFFNNSPIGNKVVTTAYLKAAAKAWNHTTYYGRGDLLRSLFQAAQFRSYYLLDQYANIGPLYGFITSDSNFPVSSTKLTILRMMDYSMYRLGYYNRSLRIIQNYSLPLAHYLQQSQTELKLRMAQGSYLYYIGNIDQSKQVYLAAQKEAKTRHVSISKARLYNNLAIDYWKSGEFDQYLSLQFRALKEAKKEGNDGLQLNILINLFTNYRINKDFTSAKQYLAKAQQLAPKKQDQRDMAKLSFSEGLLYRDLESNKDRAIASFNYALGLLSPEKDYYSYLNILTEKARVFERLTNYNHAKSLYSKILKLSRKKRDTPSILNASFNMANLYLEEGQIDSAHTILDSVSTKNLNQLDFFQLVKAKTIQTRYLEQRHEPDKASALLGPVIQQIIKRSRGSGDVETGFWQIEPEYLDAFQNYTDLLISTGHPRHAVEVLDQFKTINDAALYQNPLVRSRVLNEKELTDYKRYTDQLDQLRKQLLTVSGKDKVKTEQQIDEISAKKNALDRKITTNVQTQPLSVDAVQWKMDAHQRILHITELNDTYYEAVISRTQVRFKKIPLDKDMRSLLHQTVQQLAAGKTNLDNLYAVTRLLGINDLPPQVDKLTIIPDSYLYQLPLDVLPLHKPAHSYSYGHAEYLIEKFKTNYLTSLSDIDLPVKKHHYDYGYAGYGVAKFDSSRALVPLPHATEEVEKITTQLTAMKRKETFLNSAATEQAFRRSAPHARILHLATHSMVSGRNPMFSSIYLSGSPQDSSVAGRLPGQIFAYELFDLNLSNDLIMLNSCESGKGSYLQGTGVVGISRALRYAGARALALNLWPVNDMMASDFAVKFYDGINKGQSKPDAMRNAKLYFLKRKNADPHYWGPYMLFGNPQPIIKPYANLNNTVAASFMIFFISIALASSALHWRRGG